jgi:hypothetical protein
MAKTRRELRLSLTNVSIANDMFVIVTSSPTPIRLELCLRGDKYLLSLEFTVRSHCPALR